jgi:integration host factor subunit alpha
MTKVDLVELIYERTGSTKREAADVFEAVLDIIRETLCRGEKVKISGFGTFTVNRKRPRRGRNPQTGDPIIIEGRRVLSFKPSQVLKEMVANGDESG